MWKENGVVERPGNAPIPDSIFEDSPERQRWEQERELTIGFFRLVNASTNLQNLADAAINFFQQHSQCEAVGIRLRQGNDFPYFQTLGFPEEFLLDEDTLSARDCFGETVEDGAGGLLLECRCGDIIRGRIDPSQPSSPPMAVSGPTAAATSGWPPPDRESIAAGAAPTVTNPSP